MPTAKRTSIKQSDTLNETRNSVVQDVDTFLKPRKSSEPKEPVGPVFKPWRVFINHIDSYHGKKLVDLLSERVYVDPQGEDQLEDEQEEEHFEEEEEEEVKDEQISGSVKIGTTPTPKQYEIIGTTLNPEYPKPEDVSVIIKEPKNRDALLVELVNCGIVIYDITSNLDQVEEATWALRSIVQELETMELMAPKSFKRNSEVRYFVLISTLMTWANTKPLSSEETDLPFTEEDYRKRKAHPNFKQHMQCEKEVVLVRKKTNLKDKLKTLVICCGTTYGDEQGPLHFLFKMAWQNTPYLPVFGNGNNKIPLLHVRDLTSVVMNVLQRWPMSLRYIVAAEQEPVSQKTIVKKVSQTLSTGKVKMLAPEEAFLLPEITQQIFDLMTMNLIIDPVYIADRISWHLDTPFRDSIDNIVKEYRAARNLYPMKVIVLGPPRSGKTIVAKYLAEHYDLHYVHVEFLIKETIEKLKKGIEEATIAQSQAEIEGEDKDDDEDEEDEEESTDIEQLKELLDEVERNMERNNGHLNDSLLNRLFLRKLRSKECQNQGYVMDGYPKTLEQAKDLFAGDNMNKTMEEEIEDEAVEDETGYSILPELVVSLEASDTFLIAQMTLDFDDDNYQDDRYDVKNMMRRLEEYRKRNSEENTPLQLFDELEIPILIADVEYDKCPEKFATVSQCLDRLGPPRNYGLSADKVNQRKRIEEERRAEMNAKELRKKMELEELEKEREKRMEEWTLMMEKLKLEEEERLCVLGLPLRHYLMKYVFPTLTQGLIEVTNLMPDDPIDFLAEYLFKENPEGKMFEPDHTKAMNSLLDVIEKYQDQVLPKEELSQKITEYLKHTVDTSSSSVSDVCTSRKTTVCVTPSFTYDDTDTYDREEEEARSNKSEDYDKEA